MQIVWEVVSDLEEQQEMAARARAKVVSKLQETLHRKTEQHEVTWVCPKCASRCARVFTWLVGAHAWCFTICLLGGMDGMMSFFFLSL